MSAALLNLIPLDNRNIAPWSDPNVPQEPQINAGTSMGNDAVELLKGTGANATPAPPPIGSMTVKIDKETGKPSYTVNDVTEEAAKKFMDAIRFHDQAQSAFNSRDMLLSKLAQQQQVGNQAGAALDQAIGGLQAQQTVQQQNPLLTAVGKIASLAAANYQTNGLRGAALSPLVRAAGAFGMDQFGMTPQELSRQIAQLSQQKQASFEPQIASAERLMALDEANVRATNVERDKIESRKLVLRGQLRQDGSAGLLAATDLPSLVSQLQAEGFSDAEAANVASLAIKTSEAKQKRDVLLDAAKDARSRATITADWERQQASFGQQWKLFEAKRVDTLAKQNQVPPNVVTKIIPELDATVSQLDQLEKLIKENEPYQGPARGRIPSVILGKTGDNQKELTFRLELKNALQTFAKAHGAGSFAFRPQEYQLIFQALTPDATKTQQENLATVNGARVIVEDKIRSLGMSLQDSGKDVSKYRVFQRVGLTAGPDATTSTAPLPDEIIKKLKPGIATKLSNGEEWTIDANGTPQRVNR